jgi:hypothetical protein
VRFLGQYDNALLAHRDRSRIVPDGLRPLRLDRVGLGGLLVGGWFAGLWHSSVDKGTGAAIVDVELARPVTKRETAAVEAEGRRLAGFRHAGARTIEVRVLGG